MTAKTMYGVGAVCIGSGVIIMLLVTFAGCLTPEQRIAWNRLEAESKANQVEMAKYEQIIAETKAKLEAGTLDAATAKTLLDAVQKNKAELMKRIEGTADAFSALKDAESPWWLYVLGAMQVGLGIAAPLVGGKYGTAMRGIAEHAGKAFGALSRGADAYDEAPENDPRELGDFIAEEIKAVPGLTSDDMKKLHHAAKDCEL